MSPNGEGRCAPVFRVTRFDLAENGHFGVPRARSVGGLRRCPMQHLSSHVATRKMVHSTLDKTPASRRTGPRKTAEKRSTGHYRRTLFAILGVLVLEDAGVLARVLCTIFRVALWLERCCIGRLLRPPHLRERGPPKSAEIALFRPISDSSQIDQILRSEAVQEKRLGRKRPFWGTSCSKCRGSQKVSYAASSAPRRDSKDGA